MKLIISLLIIVINIALSGVNPYYTNIKYDRHILYPLAGENKIDIMTNNTPKQFIDNPGIVNFLFSTFSCVDNIIDNSNGEDFIKLPFTVLKRELICLGDVDTRLSGFGVLWSGIFLISIILAYCIRYKNKYDKILFNFIFTILFALLLANPYSWWARYIPHLWAFPIFVCIAFLKTNNQRIKNFIVFSILTTMLINTAIQLKYVYLIEKQFHNNLRYKINNLKIYNKEIDIFSIYDYSFIEHLKQNAIKFRFVDAEYYNSHKDEFRTIPNTLTKDMQWKIKGN